MAANGEEVRRAAMAELARRELARRESLPAPKTAAAMRKFMGPTEAQARGPASYGAGDILKGAADVAVSGVRSMVNKPAASLMGVVGAVNPNDTYMGARDRYRGAIATDELAVRDDRIRTPQGQNLSTALMATAPKTGPGALLGPIMEAGYGAVEKFLGPEARDFTESATMLAGAKMPRAATAVPRPRLTAESVVARSNNGGSAGAAAAATNVSNISPELRQSIVAQGGRNRQVSPEALNRHVEADTLPVPVRLTAGDALQDPVLLSQERNLRGKHPEMVRRMDETNKALGQNMQALRDQVGQNVFSTNAVEHGDALIAAYRAQDAAAEQGVNVAYHRLRQASGGNIPVDARAVLSNATASLHQKLLFDHAPPEIMRTLTRLADGNSMTFENFEALRTNLARIARSSADGNVKAAAGVIRQALEDLPLAQGSEHLKTLADAARATARRRFQAMEADPAYDAAVNGTVPADKFVQRFIIGAPREQLATTMRNLQGQRETVSVAVLDHLRDAARLDPGYNGNFSTAGYSRALQALDPKANLLFDAATAETLGKLRNVAGYTTAQPRGSFVNNSNTMVAGAAKYGAQALEGAANVAAGGIPVGTWAGNAVRAVGTRRLIRNSLQPGAGLVPPKNALNQPPKP
jgi:hypothetical protein